MIGFPATQPFEFTASGIECANCTIENRAATGGKMEAVFSGSPILTGVKLIQPTFCTLPSSTLSLRHTVGVLGGTNPQVTISLEPESERFDSFELSGCSAFEGIYNWYSGSNSGSGGFVSGLFNNPLGVSSKTQPFAFSGAGGYLNTGFTKRNPVSLTGTINLNEEEEFQVKESFPVNEGNAFTTPSTNPLIPRNWYTGAQPGTKLVGTQAVETSLVSEKLTFNTTVAGISTKFTAAGLECSGCKIENRAGTGENKANTEAVFSGALSYTGLKMSSPSNCSMASTVKSKSLTGVVGGEKGSSTKATFRLAPTEGATFATIELTGASCPLAGLYKMTGQEFGEFVNPLGVDAKTQRFRINQSLQEILGRSASLKFGENPLSVIGEVNMSSAVEFQAKEK
jgi:hypothetical protein